MRLRLLVLSIKVVDIQFHNVHSTSPVLECRRTELTTGNDFVNPLESIPFARLQWMG